MNIDTDAAEESPDPAGGWEPKGDAIMKEITWKATEQDVVLWDRRSPEAWLTATLALDRGETR